MFTIKLALTAFTALFAVGVNASPAGLVTRADWKDQYGWDGKVTTPVELDPKNAVKPTPGKPAPAAVAGGVFFSKNADFVEPSVSRPLSLLSPSSSPTILIAPLVSRSPAVRERLQCVGVSPEWNDVVSSFGPDPGLTCTLYGDNNCSGRTVSGVVYPGIRNLADHNLNDAMSSFRCYYQ
ncbi:hypothetical protein RhiJN_20644 [Ceratobasidium sp. AG-Ba]|nr:hypothetical protein RhiJN_20644 [Ceratobasidium sp. AG-Ba]